MTDELWPGGPRFTSGDGVFKLGTDSVLLADFVNCTHATRATDIGCGTGIIAILLALHNPALVVDGVEINPTAAQLAVHNAAQCGVGDRISITLGDVRHHRELFTAGAYDLVVSNPPYYALGSGKQAEDSGIARARGEAECTIDDVCMAAGYLTRWGGTFALVHKPARLADLFRALNSAGFEPKRMRFVQNKPESPPSLVLIESRRGGRPALIVEAPLILTNADGGDSAEIKRIYHRP